MHDEGRDAAETAGGGLISGQVEMSRDPVVVMNQAGEILGLNVAFARLWGWDPDDLLAMGAARRMEAIQERMECPEAFLERLQDLFDEPNPKCGDILALKDGRMIERRYRPRRAGDQAPGRVWTFEDVTQRRKLEEALRASEALYHSVVESLPFHLYRKDLQGRFTFCNEAFASLLGCRPEEVLGRKEASWQERGMFGRSEQEEAEIVASGMRREVVAVLHRADGRVVSLHGIKMPLYDSQGRPFGIQGVFWDVTERERFAALLAEEKERLAVTLASIGEGVITTDTQGRVLLMNRMATVLTGWGDEEARGRGVTEVFHLVDARTLRPLDDPVARVLRTHVESEEVSSAVLTTREGHRRKVAVNAAVIRDPSGRCFGVVLVFRDVTERERMEAELLKVSKLESLGILAGGIAHDFNNILMVVLGNISMAKMLPSCAKPVADRLEQAGKACLRARDLTQQLLTFAKGGAPVKKTASLAELLRESSAFALRGSSVRCELIIAEDLWLVDMDTGQISQVINNLVINAVQAMPQGGVATIRAGNLPAHVKAGLPLEGLDYVRFSVEDHGVGIRPELMGKIFDPFFTTKRTGSGLGLTTAYSILKKHDGMIEVESTVDQGSTFHVYLPASRRSGVARTESAGGMAVAVASGHGRILVMDDEALIRELAGSILSGLGYEVVVASDGGEAVAKYEEGMRSDRPFAAVIMDLMVPGGMGGKDAVGHLLRLDPGARVIVSSGYSNDPVMADHRRHGFRGVVAKPYIVEELSKVLEEVLRTASPETGGGGGGDG